MYRGSLLERACGIYLFAIVTSRGDKLNNVATNFSPHFLYGNKILKNRLLGYYCVTEK